MRLNSFISTTLASATLILSFAMAVCAIDGVAVSIHYEGLGYETRIGHYGTLMRHDIRNWNITHSVLYNGSSGMKALCPRIDPRDGSQVAFIREDGKVCLMPINGGPMRVIVNNALDGFIDWSTDYIYYIVGYAFTRSTRDIRRVNVNTGVDQLFRTFSIGLWRFQVSDDDKRMEIRAADDWPQAGTGTIFPYDMVVNNGVLNMNRSTGYNFHCQDMLSPSGEYLADGWQDHLGITIRRWDDLSYVTDMWWEDDVDKWGPGVAVNRGPYASKNTYSANSDWALACRGWDLMEGAGNQFLFNWETQQKLAITNNARSSDKYDDCGDFYLGLPSALNRPETPSVKPVELLHRTSDRTFAIAAHAPWHFSLCNVSGKTVFQKAGQGNAQVNIPTLAAGAYVAQVRTNGSSSAIKINLSDWKNSR